MNTAFIGNSHAVSYFENIIASKHGGFLLLTGPQYIGKTTLLMNNLEKLISPFHMGSDYRFIQDFSDIRGELKDKNDKLTGTDHTLKIENDSSKQDIKLNDGSIYQDRGAREIIDRLVKSPIGGKKLLIIENIERMTTQASNAFLKTLEEPLDNRFIIATSSNSNYLLDTIRSRATIVQFTATDENYESLGRPGLARRLGNIPKYQDLHTIIQSITQERWTKELISTKQSIFVKAHENGLLPLLLDILLVKFADNQLGGKPSDIISHKLYRAKKLLESNVGVGNIIMNMCI